MVTTGMIDYKRATVGYNALPGGCDLILFFFFSGADSIIEGAIGPTAKGIPREHAREQNASDMRADRHSNHPLIPYPFRLAPDP